VGNILGGIAIQTVVLVILDIRVRDEPLTYLAASLALLVEALVVIAVLAVVIAGTQLPIGLVLLRLTPDTVLIALIWLVGLLLVRRAGTNLPWHESGHAPGSQAKPRGHSKSSTEAAATKRGMSTGVSALLFSGAAVVTLAAGVFLEQSGSAMASRVGLSGVLFGATVLALATSLPEISTGLASVKEGDYKLAMSDIFGGNAFLPVLFLVATLLSGKAVLPHAHPTDIYLTALGIVLTLVYALGLLFRPRRQFLRMGLDSVLVLVLYLVGIAGLFAVAGTG
jgi:cation:H+ antiporter